MEVPTQMRPTFVRVSRSMGVPRSVPAATAYRSHVAFDEGALAPSSSRLRVAFNEGVPAASSSRSRIAFDEGVHLSSASCVR